MAAFALAAGAKVGRVHLQVADLGRSLDFYRDLLGFRQVARDGATAHLSATGAPPLHVVLGASPGARRKPAGTTGLYHVAIRFPDRRALARVFRRLAVHEWPFQGFADHRVSEALYLADPDGNGLELYVDRPEAQWTRRAGQIEMATDPLDVDDLLAAAAGDRAPWRGIDPGVDVGHVHLQVADLARAEAFYGGVLGLDVTQRSYPGALFLSAGGYHHHVGLNVWAGAGAPSPPPDAVGLRSFALRIPGGDAWQSLIEHVRASGVAVEGVREDATGRAALVRDPDGIGVELVTAAVRDSSTEGGSRR
jgi:catechol 2,3-dioxygenase